MKIVRGFALGMATLAVVFFAAGGAYADTPVTVGDFLGAYAKAMNIQLPANADSDAVVAALKASGVKLDAGLDTAKALTQGDVVRVAKANGLRMTTRNPESAFTLSEMDQFFTSYGATLTQGNDRVAASDNPPGDPANNANTTKGKKKGRPFQSPTEPE